MLHSFIEQKMVSWQIILLSPANYIWPICCWEFMQVYILMLNETNSCVRQIDGLLFLNEQAAGQTFTCIILS